jgi:hypothetical protein
MEQLVGELGKQIREQEETIKKAQEDVYKAKASDGWSVESDSAVNGQLGSLERAIKGFCKQYATKAKEEMSLDQRLRAEDHTIFGMMNEDGLLALEDARMEKVAPALLLSAWLTHFVYQNIVANAFFFVDELECVTFQYETPFVAMGLSRCLNTMQMCKFKMLARLIIPDERT